MGVSEEDFLAVVETFYASKTAFLTEAGPLLLAAAYLELANDTRSFARKFEIAHALVLRECVHLQDDLALLSLDDRGERSGRVFFALTSAARQLVSTPAVMP